MKTNYALKSSIKPPKLSLPVRITIGIFAVLILLHFIFPVFLGNLFMTLARPFWSFGIGDRPSAQTLSLQAQNVIIAELQKENAELKAFNGRKDQKDTIVAYILKKPPFTAYDSLILDVGLRDGVRVGDKVYAPASILVGYVDQVSNSTSKVKLYSSYGEKYEVLIGEKNIQVTAMGRGGGLFETVIPRDIKIKEGDTVTIPDISNAVFGLVGKIIADPARAFSTVIFSQPINIYEQKWVTISLTNSTVN
jgi:cell shape-determining protein MreC